MITRTGLKPQVLDYCGKTLAGLWLKGCRGVVVQKLKSIGGSNGITLEDCQDCRIEDCDVSGVVGSVDPAGYGVQFIRCKTCSVTGTDICRGPASEDGVNVYMSSDVLVRDCVISGHGDSDSGNGVTVDYKSVRCTIEHNSIDTEYAAETASLGYCGVVVAAGSGHLIRYNTITAPIPVTVRNTYRGVTRDVLVSENECAFTDTAVFVDAETTAEVVVR